MENHGIGSKGQTTDLVKRCEMHDPPIPTKKEVVNIVREGWHGKSKGSFISCTREGTLIQPRLESAQSMDVWTRM